MKYKWPLNDSQFTLLDRLKICKFFLQGKNRWTQDIKVAEFEREMAAFMDFKYSVFTSSGSTANTILAMYLRDKLKAEKSKRNIVVLPAVTWQTSCSPWIREGFEPHFIDVSLDNFGIDLEQLEKFLFKNHDKVAAVFPTALLGFNLDYDKLKALQGIDYRVSFFIDQCENNFGDFDSTTASSMSLSRTDFTCTLSTYMGHQIQSCEGGFLLTNNRDQYIKFLMYRNHGMVRSLEKPTFKLEKEDEAPLINNFNNVKVDSRFDFYSLGNNFRNTDIHALIGLLDLKKATKHIKARRRIYHVFCSYLNKDRYFVPRKGYWGGTFVPFCIPVICKGDNLLYRRFYDAKNYCIENKIETRPIISGFLGYQTPYKKFMNEKDFPNAVFLHENGFYIGLHPKVKEKDVIKLAKYLNQI